MERKCILFQTNKIQEQILQIIGYSAMGIRRERNCSPAIYSRCKFWGHINQAKSRSLGLTGLKSHSSPNTTRDLPPHCPRPPWAPHTAIFGGRYCHRIMIKIHYCSWLKTFHLSAQFSIHEAEAVQSLQSPAFCCF